MPVNAQTPVRRPAERLDEPLQVRVRTLERHDRRWRKKPGERGSTEIGRFPAQTFAADSERALGQANDALPQS